MPRYDDKTESFIIRIWVEPREFSGAPFVWRGEIEHVTSRQRHFFDELEKIGELLRPYLAEIRALHMDTINRRSGGKR